MSQKSSLPQPAESVPRVLTADTTVTTAVMAQTRPRVPVMITADPDTDPCGVGVVEVLDSRDDGFLDVSFG